MSLKDLKVLLEELRHRQEERDKKIKGCSVTNDIGKGVIIYTDLAVENIPNVHDDISRQSTIETPPIMNNSVEENNINREDLIRLIQKT